VSEEEEKGVKGRVRFRERIDKKKEKNKEKIFQ